MNDMFQRAVAIVLAEEGVFSDDERDPGGETKYGISAKAYPRLDIKNMTLVQAKSLYLTDYWLRNRCEKMPWWAALCVFDASVNQGVRPAARMMQQAVGVFQDDQIGPVTLKAIGSANPLETMATYQTLRAYRYFNTIQFDVYGKGWLRRLHKTSARSLQDQADVSV